jgi:hypothetical protein
MYCVCDEYAEMERFLNETPNLKGKLEYVLQRIKYDSYMWNYNRLVGENKYIFLEHAASEFEEALSEGTLRKDYFEPYRWDKLSRIVDNPARFHMENMLDSSKDEEWITFKKIRNSKTYKLGKKVAKFYNTVYKFFRCLKKHGIRYTFTISLKERLAVNRSAQKS